MSELTANLQFQNLLKRTLLGTVSLLTIVGYSVQVGSAMAADDTEARPTIWIELGGQLERRDGGDPQFVPVFETAAVNHGFAAPTSYEKQPRYSVGGEGRIEFQPSGTDWKFTAAVRYGRSNGGKNAYQQTPYPWFYSPGGQLIILAYYDLLDVHTQYKESHTVLDFQAGRDVGLGVFGSSTTSTLSLGVRVAQFSNREVANFSALPNMQYVPPGPPKYFPHLQYTRFVETAEAARSFHGIGPSIDWKGSVKIAGNERDTKLLFDWGLNGSVLIGRQQAKGFQKTHEKIVTFIPIKYTTDNRSLEFDRSRTVVIPNVGGEAAISLAFPNAKLTFGYRADFFFGAMDGGIATAKRYDRNFYGPFATISVGLGG